MAAARRVVEGDHYVRAGRWRTWEPELLLGKDVYGATLGLVGFGRIGRAVARRATGFGMRVLYTRRRRTESAHPELGKTSVFSPLPNPSPPGWSGQSDPSQVDFESLLRASDFISIHAPLTPETRGMFDRAAFATMQSGAILINTARGALIDTEALYEALSSGQLGAAALDVTDPEPIPPGHPLLALPDCLIVPHIGSASVKTRSRMARIAAENLLAGVRGERLPYCANPEVYG
jgi:lactate dehydrogenase-like 2-hydroxyacid dehydrogenase